MVGRNLRIDVCSLRAGSATLPTPSRGSSRVLDSARAQGRRAGIDGGEKRLSWHALRHSAGSIWLTGHGNPITTVSEQMGHSKPAFTLKCYGRDPRDEQAVVADMAGAGSEGCERRMKPDRYLTEPSPAHFHGELARKKTRRFQRVQKADEGTRTLDLLHGKQTL